MLLSRCVDMVRWSARVFCFFLIILLSSCGRGEWLEYEVGGTGVFVTLPGDSSVNIKMTPLSEGSYYSTLLADRDEEKSYMISVLYYPELGADLLDDMADSSVCEDESIIDQSLVNIFEYQAVKVLCRAGNDVISEIYSFIRDRQYILITITHHDGVVKGDSRGFVSHVRFENNQ